MKGISFSPAMLKAYRDGRKTMTRRLVKRPRGYSDAVWNSAVPHDNGDGGHGIFGTAPYLRVDADDDAGIVGQRIRCPYGGVGDKLWIKEALFAKDGLLAYASDEALVLDETGRPQEWP
jgi:hypothetical protein